MNSGHDENTVPAQENCCHLQHPTALRGHRQVLRETSGINSSPVSFQLISHDCEGTCPTPQELSKGRAATSTAGPSKTDLPAEWDCVFIRTLPDLVPYTVRPIVSACAEAQFPINMSCTLTSSVHYSCSCRMRVLRDCYAVRAVECYRGWCPEPFAGKGKQAGL